MCFKTRSFHWLTTRQFVVCWYADRHIVTTPSPPNPQQLHPVFRKLQLFHILPSYSLRTYWNSVLLSLTYTSSSTSSFPETLGFKDAFKVITFFWSQTPFSRIDMYFFSFFRLSFKFLNINFVSIFLRAASQSPVIKDTNNTWLQMALVKFVHISLYCCPLKSLFTW